MQPRINPTSAAALAATRTMMNLETHVHKSGLERSLIELVKTRVSQINGCAYCIDMHTRDARAAGETEQRLYALSAWRETPFFSDRERAALEWAESLTRIAGHGVPEELFQHTRKHFTETELVDLTIAVVAINGWNRIALSFAAVPGSYQPRQHTAGVSA